MSAQQELCRAQRCRQCGIAMPACPRLDALPRRRPLRQHPYVAGQAEGGGQRLHGGSRGGRVGVQPVIDMQHPQPQPRRAPLQAGQQMQQRDGIGPAAAGQGIARRMRKVRIQRAQRAPQIFRRLYRRQLTHGRARPPHRSAATVAAVARKPRRTLLKQGRKRPAGKLV